MKKILMMAMILCIVVRNVDAQETKPKYYPKVGDTLNHTFDDLVNFPTKTASLKDLRGKWVILDMWSVGCVACIRSFPKMDSIAQQFKDKVHVIMVGLSNAKTYDRNKNVYKVMKDKHKLKMTFAFDSVMGNKYDVGLIPYILVINPQGVLIYKTGKINSFDVAKITNGESVSLEKAYSWTEPMPESNYNGSMPLLTSGVEANGGNDTSFLFRSLLAKANEKMIHNDQIDFFRPANKWNVENGKVELLNVSIERLYLAAYFGANIWGWNNDKRYDLLYPKIIWKSHKTVDLKTRWAYSLIVPASLSNAEFLSKTMRNDIENYFGVCAKVVDMEVSVYFLEIADSKIASKLIKAGNGLSKVMLTEKGADMKNYSTIDMRRILATRMKLDRPLLDRAGLPEKINLNFVANFADPSDIKEKLSNYGLRIVEGRSMMKAIVIEDLPVKGTSFGFNK